MLFPLERLATLVLTSRLVGVKLIKIYLCAKYACAQPFKRHRGKWSDLGGGGYSPRRQGKNSRAPYGVLNKIVKTVKKARLIEDRWARYSDPQGG